MMSIFAFSQTDGALNVSVNTSEVGGTYAPRNCVAIWVEDGEGYFVKTLLAYAQNYKTHLNNWEASTTAAGSAFNKTDAISGATKTSHGTRTCSWDGTNYQGTTMVDGTYRVCMELTDKNSTGNFSCFSFTKSNIEESQTPANMPSFSTIVLAWAPGENAIADFDIAQISILPNPTKGVVKIDSKDFKSVEVWSITGKCILTSNYNTIDISNQANGVYFVKIETKDGIFTRRILKN